MPGKSKKGGGLEVSPYKMKGSPMKRNFGIGATLGSSPLKLDPVTIAVVTGVAGAVAGKVLGGKGKVGGPGITDPGEELGKLKIGTGQKEDPIQY